MSNETALRVGAAGLVAAALLVVISYPGERPPEFTSSVDQLVHPSGGADEYAAALVILRSATQPKDAALAFTHFQNAAREGHPGAQYQLSKMFAEGIGTKASSERSLMWLHIAAESGVPDAELQLGMAFLEGRRLPKDLVQAYSWLSIAAAHGVAGTASARDAALAAMSPAEVTAARVHVERLSLRTSIGFEKPERPIRQTPIESQ